MDQPIAPIPERAISDHFNACLAFLSCWRPQFLDPPLFAFREPHVTTIFSPEYAFEAVSQSGSRLINTRKPERVR